MVSVHLVGFVSESIYFGLTTSITWFYLTRLLWRLAYLLTAHHACVAHRAALWRLTIPKFTVASRQRPVNQPIMNMNTNLNWWDFTKLHDLNRTSFFRLCFWWVSVFFIYIYIHILCVCYVFTCYSRHWYIRVITLHIYKEKRKTLTLTSLKWPPSDPTTATFLCLQGKVAWL